MIRPAPKTARMANSPARTSTRRPTAEARPEPPSSRSRTQAAVRVRERVPSPNRRRIMYGRRSAAVSASAVPDPPRIQAMLASLANPSSRESSVPPVTTMALCSISPVWPGEAGVFAGGDAGAAFDLFMKISQVKVGFRRDGATGRQPGGWSRKGRPGRPGRPRVQTVYSSSKRFL